MWELEPRDIPDDNTFIHAKWPPTSCAASQAETLKAAVASSDNFAFFGLTTTPDGSCNGIAAGAYLDGERARVEIERILANSGFVGASIEVTRWRRGGRTK